MGREQRAFGAERSPLLKEPPLLPTVVAEMASSSPPPSQRRAGCAAPARGLVAQGPIAPPASSPPRAGHPALLMQKRLLLLSRIQAGALQLLSTDLVVRW